MYNLVKHCAHKTQDEEKHSKNNKHSIAQKTKMFSNTDFAKRNLG
jgi:hypothetical protein